MRLQKTRLTLYGVAAAAALGCADTGARLSDRLLERTWDSYVVQPGDTLARIAACSGVTVVTLARVNEISAPDRLRAGTVLRVPHRGDCAEAPRLAAKVPRARRTEPARGGSQAAAVQGEVARLLAKATARYDAADFEQALSLAQAGIQALAPYPGDAEADALRARCHMVSGMAAAGLERSERAIAEFRQALDAAPDLELDPQRTSPRVLELVDAARASPSASGPPDERFVESSAK